MRAIDLYSGVGGWTLGLEMAGIETVASYEWWGDAVETYKANFHREAHQVDIRALPVSALPKNVTYVVGSPPCTEFSFSNRGGGGDILNGLTDVAKFLELVEGVSPRYWVMENVPRVAGILERELERGGRLRRFADLVDVITVVDMADFGLPQRRRRMLAGSFPVELLRSYRDVTPTITLGDVLKALRGQQPRNPIYSDLCDAEALSQNETEEPLNEEEMRMNREAKRFHPFYNVMSFPDRLDRPSRTVTATCTRVSRESIIIPHSKEGALRRLTLRERASLQGFPLTFEFSGSSYNANLKLVGNAFPPLMAFYVAHSMLETPSEHLPKLVEVDHQLPPKTIRPLQSTPPRQAGRYSRGRRFRAALPNLRFGSGVRFELANRVDREEVSWLVSFYFGSSKRIQTVPLDEQLLRGAKRYRAFGGCYEALERFGDKLNGRYEMCTGTDLQDGWTHSSNAIHPFELVDDLGDLALEVHDSLPESDYLLAERFVLGRLEHAATAHGDAGLGNAADKIRRHAPWILAGFLAGAWFNVRSGLSKA